MADFLGVSNLMDADAKGATASGNCRVMVGEFELEAGQGETTTTGATKITIRPERVRLLSHTDEGPNRLPGMVERPVYLGNSVQLIVRLANGDTVQALIQNVGEEIPFKQGDPVKVFMPAEALRVLTDTGTAPIEDHPAAAVASGSPANPMSDSPVGPMR